VRVKSLRGALPIADRCSPRTLAALAAAAPERPLPFSTITDVSARGARLADR
jgi:hypothetical protein